jgi:hypothetical protein
MRHLRILEFNKEVSNSSFTSRNGSNRPPGRQTAPYPRTQTSLYAYLYLLNFDLLLTCLALTATHYLRAAIQDLIWAVNDNDGGLTCPRTLAVFLWRIHLGIRDAIRTGGTARLTGLADNLRNGVSLSLGVGEAFNVAALPIGEPTIPPRAPFPELTPAQAAAAPNLNSNPWAITAKCEIDDMLQRLGPDIRGRRGVRLADVFGRPANELHNLLPASLHPPPGMTSWVSLDPRSVQSCWLPVSP